MVAPDASIVDLSLGVFADFSPPSPAALQWAIGTLAVEDIVFGAWSSAPNGRPFRPRGWKLGQLSRAVDTCVAAGVRPHLMIWAKRHIDALPFALDWLDLALAAVPGLSSVLLDCEGHWHKGHGLTADSAADLVDRRLAGVQWGVTGLTKVHRTVRPLAERATYVVPQCYSFWRPGSKHWSHSRETAPQYQQAVGVDSWSRVNDRVVMALGCYWAARPAYGSIVAPLTATQTLRACAAETSALGVEKAWYWSLKWLRAKTKAGDEVRDFFGVTL